MSPQDARVPQPTEPHFRPSAPDRPRYRMGWPPEASSTRRLAPVGPGPADALTHTRPMYSVASPSHELIALYDWLLLITW